MSVNESALRTMLNRSIKSYTTSATAAARRNEEKKRTNLIQKIDRLGTLSEQKKEEKRKKLHRPQETRRYCYATDEQNEQVFGICSI